MWADLRERWPNRRASPRRRAISDTLTEAQSRRKMFKLFRKVAIVDLPVALCRPSGFVGAELRLHPVFAPQRPPKARAARLAENSAESPWSDVSHRLR